MAFSPNWFPELALRTLRVLSIGFIVLNVWSIRSSYNRLERSPLLPDTLAAYSAFPHYFFIAFYLMVIYAIFKLLRGDYNIQKWWIPVILVILFEFFKFYIYGVLMFLNPFG